MSAVDYRKFANRVCNAKEAGFIGIGFVVAIGIIAAIILGIYFGTQCSEGDLPCQDGYTCRPKSDWCDGKFDCPNGDDEFKCYSHEFYVAFRTHLPGDANNTALNETYSALLKQRLPPFNGSVPDNVEIFRYRKVNVSGHTLLDNATGDGISWAADAIVRYPIFGPVCQAEGSVLTAIFPDDIINALRMDQPNPAQNQIQFHAAGAGVTTGVAVILTGNPASNCKRPTVYCNLATPCAVYQFSSKGCPSYPCTCTAQFAANATCTPEERF